MTQLPQLLRRMPYIFYGIAVLLFAWNLGNQWVNITTMMGFTDPTMQGVEAYQKSLALYSAFTDSIYMLANGTFLHVLIAIYDKMKGSEA